MTYVRAILASLLWLAPLSFPSAQAPAGAAAAAAAMGIPGAASASSGAARRMTGSGFSGGAGGMTLPGLSGAPAAMSPGPAGAGGLGAAGRTGPAGPAPAVGGANTGTMLPSVGGTAPANGTPSTGPQDVNAAPLEVTGAGRDRAGLAAEPPSEFQRFVATATGQNLPIFGAGLFRGSRFEPVQATQVPDGYVIGPGDELVIQLYGAVDLLERFVVDREGRILIPRVGPIRVAGLRFSELEGHITRSIGEIYRNFRLSVSMGRLRSIEIYVLGQARAPGRKVVSSLSTLINALFETGGPAASGSMRAIELRRRGQVVTRLDLYDFIARGSNSADRALEPGDIIFIPAVGPQVALVGSVSEPAIYELTGKARSIRSLLDLHGGLPTLATPQKAQIERIDPAQQPSRFVQDIALDAKGLATTLRAGDILTVLQIGPQFANAVTLQGSVAAPMRYPHREGMKISDLVSGNNFLVPVSYWLRLNEGANIAGLYRPEVNLDYATIQRLDPVRLRTEIIPFNLSKALLGQPTDNLPLKPGDVVRVYAANETGPDAINSVSLQAPALGGARRFVWREGQRVTDLIPNMAWLSEQLLRWVRPTDGSSLYRPEVNLDYATLHRVDPVKLRTEVIPFNLGLALRGSPTENLALRPGDVLRIYRAGESGADAIESIAMQASFLSGVQRFAWRDGQRVTDLIPNIDWLRERVTLWIRTQGLGVVRADAQAGSTVPIDPALALEGSALRGLPPQTSGTRLMPGQRLGEAAVPVPGQPPGTLAAAAGLAAGTEGRLAGSASGAQQAPAGRARAGQADQAQVADFNAANLSQLSVASFQEVNLEYADIKRLDPRTLQLQLIPFSLARALTGSERDNLRLQPGDLITLYTRKEVAVPVAQRTRLVKLSGEVRIPGTYQVSAGETLADLIQRAGGLTKDAYAYGTSFVRESTRFEQRRNLDQLVRTLEADVLSAANAAAQNTTQADAQQAQALIAFQRQYVERLRTLEVSGRIALDLSDKDERPELPRIELEDGDVISVPTRSDFVGVFGAVDISSSLIFRSGARVRDYLDRAGVRPLADLDNIVLLRADGTVRTARNTSQRTSFFGLGGDGLMGIELKPGDAILVPEQVDRRTGYTRFMIGAKDWTQLIYQFGLGAAAFKVLNN
jgi:protein involved in polysaccharide export with SLBB domain